MGKVRGYLKHIPFVDAALSLTETMGIHSLLRLVGAALWAAAVMASAWIWNNVPVWGMALIFTVTLAITCWFLALAMRAYRDFRVARAMSKFDPTQYQEFGQELVSLSQEIFRFLADRQRDQGELHKANPRTLGDGGSFEMWRADRDFEKTTAKLFFEKFGTKVLGSAALLHRIGIKMPHHLVATSQYHPNGITQFLGLIGDLLKRGNIDDAIKISEDQEFMWQIQH